MVPVTVFQACTPSLVGFARGATKCKDFPSNPQEARGAPTHSSTREGGVEHILRTSNAVLLVVVGSTPKGVLIPKR